MNEKDEGLAKARSFTIFKNILLRYILPVALLTYFAVLSGSDSGIFLENRDEITLG